MEFNGTKLEVGRRYLFVKENTALPEDLDEGKVLELNDKPRNMIKVKYLSGITEWITLLDLERYRNITSIILLREESEGRKYETITT